MMVKNSPDLLSGSFWMGISVLVAVESLELGVGRLHNPGPGFLPFWSAVIFGVLGFILIVTNIQKTRRERRVADLWKHVEWKKVIWVTVSLFLYGFLFSKIGYLLATFGVMIFLLRIMRRSRMWVPEIAGAIVIALASYFLFGVMMGIQLPKGILDL
jgi:putative tricarboxylic transport membrane protein